MNDISNHLKEAIDKGFTKEDAQIISCLVEIFDLIHYYDLKKILDNYKRIPDEDILNLLRRWIEEGPVDSKVLIKFGDKEINTYFLQTITYLDSYDNFKKCPIYKVIFNQDESEKLLMSNTEVVFYSQEQRDKEIRIFKKKTKYLKIKYI